MPNWCNNNITITGPVETINQLWKDAVEADGLLEAIKPMPKELEGTTAPSESGDDWYTWRVNNWSTKWDVSLEGLELIDNKDGTACITGWFDSAWSPPIGAYESFCDDMDNCSLYATYYEPGMDFAGIWDNGVDDMLEAVHAEYELPEEQQSDLFRQLDDEFGLSEQFAQYDEFEEIDNA